MSDNYLPLMRAAEYIGVSRVKLSQLAKGGVIPFTTSLLDLLAGWIFGVTTSFDERWYLDTSLEIALERLALRHMQAWGITRDAAEHRIATSDRLNAELVQNTAQFANWRLVV